MDDVTGGMTAAGLNFDLPEEIRMLKETVRKFVDREMIPDPWAMAEGVHIAVDELRTAVKSETG